MGALVFLFYRVVINDNIVEALSYWFKPQLPSSPTMKNRLHLDDK